MLFRIRRQLFKLDDYQDFLIQLKVFNDELLTWTQQLKTLSEPERSNVIHTFENDLQLQNDFKLRLTSEHTRNYKESDSKADRAKKLILYKNKKRLVIYSREQISNAIKLLKLDKNQVDTCGCKYKQELSITYRTPPADTVLKVGTYTDGYYNYELYKCSRCKVYWVNDLYSDDGPSKGFRSLGLTHKNMSLDEILSIIVPSQ